MREITILSRPDCHLCEVVLKIARRLQKEAPFTLTKVDIDNDTDLARRYGTRIPVVLIDQVEVCAGKITEGDLRRALDKTRRKGLISRIRARLKALVGKQGLNP